MRRSKPQSIRNKLDLTDRRQVRLIRKRLGLSGAELTQIVARSGNSLSAISKEVALQRTNVLPQQADVPLATATASVPAEQTTIPIPATAVIS